MIAGNNTNSRGSLHGQVAALHATGLPKRAIAERVGVSARTIDHMIRLARNVDAQGGHVDNPGIVRRRPTIDDIAIEAGVCASTVSNYLTGKGRMSNATRERIREAAERLQFTPSSLARAMRERRTNIIGLVTFGLTGIEGEAGGSIMPPLLQGLVDRADALDQEILLYTGWPQRSARYSNLTFLNGHVDGVIWMAPQVDEPILERLAQARLPVVSLLSRHVPDSVGYVNADNFGGIRMIVEHLAALGHRRIALACRPATSNFVDRRDAYRNALAGIGIPVDHELEAGDGWHWEDYESALGRWMLMPDRPTAIITSDDSVAHSAVEAIRERGLRVPEDMAVTGFNGVSNGADSFAGLTTVRQPFRDLAATAVDRLVALIEGAPPAECRVTLPTQLIVSQSTVRRTWPNTG